MSMPAFSDATSLIQIGGMPQIVPSHVCVACDVCCRFPEAESFLRPYFTAQEIEAALARGLDPAYFADRRGGQVSLVRNPAGEGFLCPAFDPATSHCRIYDVRPLDCQIYPLALMWGPPSAAGKEQEAIGNSPESSPSPEAHSPLPQMEGAGLEAPGVKEQVVLGWDTKCPFLGEAAGVKCEASYVKREGEQTLAGELSRDILDYAERMATLIEEPLLGTIAANPRLIGKFQDDVVIIRSLPKLTERLRGHRGNSGTIESSLASTGSGMFHASRFTLHALPLTFADRPRLEAACANLATPLAAYAFAPHYIWRDLFAYSWAEVDGHFCLFAEYADGVYMPLPPLPAAAGMRHEAIGDRPESAPLPIAPRSSPASLAACFTYMHERNKGSAVSRIENVSEEWKPEFETLGCRLAPKDPDYLYRTSDLVALAGDRYKSQRAACNRLQREHRCELISYQPAHRDACLALFQRWRRQQTERPLGDMAGLLLHDAESAHRQALTHAESLGLTGRVALIDGEVRAYTFGYARSPSVFCVLLEVADRTVTGLAQFVFREFCREAADRGFEYLNTMDDSGLPHLAAAKRAYHPVRLVPSFIASR